MLHYFIFIVNALGSNCPSYSCGSGYTTNQCQVYSNSSGVSSYTLTQCQPGLICPAAQNSSAICQSPSTRSRYPGDYCQQNSDCRSNNCNGNSLRCIGNFTGQGCSTSGDCQPGNFCSSKFVCTQHLAAKSACTTTDNCTIGLVCDLKVCVGLFSIANNKPTGTILSTGLAPACASGYARNISNVTTCTIAPVSLNTSVAACPLTGMCLNSFYNVSKPCVCGFNQNSYCPLFEGDPPVVGMIQQTLQLTSFGAGSCNSMNRYGYLCYYNTTVFSLYLNWYVNASIYFNDSQVLISTAPSCVQNTLLSSYLNIYYQQQNIQTCPTYACTTSITGWSSNQCVYYSNNILNNKPANLYLINTCPTSYSCTPSIKNNVTCAPVIPQSNNYPGEYCNSNGQCYSGKCSSSKCEGQKAGASCASAYCNPGLFCNSNKVCQSTFPNTQRCSSQAQCDTYSLCQNGICIRLFSLPDGADTYLTSTDYGFSTFCQSGFAQMNQETPVCTTAPVSPLPGLTNCSLGSTCSSLNSAYSKPCTCSFTGQSYCPQFEGDHYLTNAINWFNKLIQLNTSCYASILTPNCFKNDNYKLLTYYYYYTNYTTYAYYSQLQNQQSCIQQNFFSSYWQAMNYINTNAYVQDASMLGIMISGLFITLSLF